MNTQAIQKCFEAGEIEEGLDHWRTHLTNHPTPSNSLEYLHLLIPLYRLTEAREIATLLIAHPDVNTTHLLPAARLLFKASDISTSAKLTAKALTLQPTDPDIVAIHAANLERTGHRDQAKTLLQDTLKTHPNHLRCIRLLAHLARIAGNLSEARNLLEARLDGPVSRDDWRLATELAPILERLGEPEKAFEQITFAKGRLLTQSSNLRQQWLTISERQWQVALMLDSDRLARWSRPISPSQKICLLAGFPRSGTTLLERILTTHPHCLGTDESGVLASQFRDPIVLMANSTKAAMEELDSFDQDSLLAGRQEYLRCTTEALGQEVCNHLLIEKDPLLTVDFAIPLRLFPESKIIMPIRDPRDVVISYYFTIVPTTANSIASATLEDCCRNYAMTMRHWLWLKENLPQDRWLESRYEDLLADPETRTRQLASFLEIPWSPDMLDHSRRDASKAISTPTYADVARPLYTRAKGRWQHYEKHLAPHLHHLAPFLREFGYQD